MSELTSKKVQSTLRQLDRQMTSYTPFLLFAENLKPFAKRFIEDEREKLLEKALYQSSRFELLVSGERGGCPRSRLYHYLKQCFNYESSTKNNLSEAVKIDLVRYDRYAREADACKNALSSIEFIYSHFPEYFYDKLGIRYIGDVASYWYDNLCYDFISLTSFIFLLLPYIYLFDQRIEACDMQRLNEVYLVESRKIKNLPVVNLACSSIEYVEKLGQMPFLTLFEDFSIDELMYHVQDLREHCQEYRCRFAGMSIIESARIFWAEKDAIYHTFTTRFCSSLFLLQKLAI